MQLFLSGGLATMSALAAIFFSRFWVTSRDRLFLYFALGFGMLAIHWAALALTSPPVEARHELYVVRLAAFLLIFFGIVEKNLRRPGGGRL